jgi:hypothetical protein
MPAVRSSVPPGNAARRRFADNPFFVLELTPRATARDIHRAAARLCEALERGDPTVGSYPTPVGPQPRTAELVRASVTRLRDRDERVQYEIWATAEPSRPPQTLGEADADGAFAGAFGAFGWGLR